MRAELKREYDAVVVGSGPNGLSAAITLAREGLAVIVLEARSDIGGGARTAALTQPGFLHDVCSAVHPLALGSPFLRNLPLDQYGLEWIVPETALAHPLDDGHCVVLKRNAAGTAERLGQDGGAYKRTVGYFSERWWKLSADILGPLSLPKHPLLVSRFARYALRSSHSFVRTQFTGGEARSLLTGLSAHCSLPLTEPITAAFGMVLAIAGHAVGWPIPKGGAGSIVNAMAAYFRSLGGTIVTDEEVKDVNQLCLGTIVMLDLTPRQIVEVAGDRLPAKYVRELNQYRYGNGVFKMDWALKSEVPFVNDQCSSAAAVHLGGDYQQIEQSELDVSEGRIPQRPYIIFSQQSRLDKTRAPDGKHTAWAYCHVPSGSTVDMTDAIESAIERVAPGFREQIILRHAMHSQNLERYNPNYVDGDIGGGQQIWRQQFTRPTRQIVPYRTPIKGLYICSSSTPPGAGVHGMCGYHAARVALADMYGLRPRLNDRSERVEKKDS